MIEDVFIPPGPAGGVFYLAWCAYPGANEHDARKKWASAVYALPQRAMGAGRLVPGFPKVPKAEHLGPIAGRGAKRIWHRRLPAVWLAEKRMRADGSKATAAYVELANALPAEFGMNRDEDAVKRLCWRESLPVLPLLYPVARLLLAHMPDSLTAVDRVHWLAYHGDVWVPKAVDHARTMAREIGLVFSPQRLLRPALLVRGVLHIE